MFNGKYSKQIGFGEDTIDFNDKALRDLVDDQGDPLCDEYKPAIRQIKTKIGELQSVARALALSPSILLVAMNRATGHQWNSIKYKNFDRAKEWARANISRWFEIVAPEIHVGIVTNIIYKSVQKTESLVKSV